MVGIFLNACCNILHSLALEKHNCLDQQFSLCIVFHYVHSESHTAITKLPTITLIRSDKLYQKVWLNLCSNSYCVGVAHHQLLHGTPPHTDSEKNLTEIQLSVCLPNSGLREKKSSHLVS